MKKINGKWWLAVVAVCCLSPAAAFADWDHGGHGGHGGQGCDPRWQNCYQAPEGGSNAIYLIGAGLTCFGAMFLRSRTIKQTQS